MPSDALGEYRSQGIYRLIALIYLATLGAMLIVPIAALIAMVFFIIDWLSNLLLDRPADLGRTVGTAPLRWHFHLTKYALWGEEAPGLYPSGEDAGPAA